jgi:hypothetical protein
VNQIPFAPAPIRSVTRLSIVDPDGTVHDLGAIYWNRSKFLTALLDAPLKLHRDFNIRRHNKRMERLAARKRSAV